MAQSAQKRMSPKHFVQAMEPHPTFQSLPFKMTCNLREKSSNFMDISFVSIPMVSISCKKLLQSAGHAANDMHC